MCKQMILTILVISLALGTETEFQRRIILLGPAADRTLMSDSVRVSGGLSHLGFELLPSVHLVRRIALIIAR